MIFHLVLSPSALENEEVIIRKIHIHIHISALRTAALPPRKGDITFLCLRDYEHDATRLRFVLGGLADDVKPHRVIASFKHNTLIYNWLHNT